MVKLVLGVAMFISPPSFSTLCLAAERFVHVRHNDVVAARALDFPAPAGCGRRRHADGLGGGHTAVDLRLLKGLGRLRAHVHTRRNVAVLPLERLDLRVLRHLCRAPL